MRSLFLALLLILPSGKAAGPEAGWQMLKSLTGEWHAVTGEGKDMSMSYQVISNGSAVMETLKAPDGSPFMVTVYHQDGDALMATHYCAAGNQPRMRAEPPAAGPKRIVFRFLDITNLKSPGTAHIRHLTLTLDDASHMTQEWTSREGGKDVKMIFRLTRSAGK
ncbi:MAG: hypothetical protein IT158_07100 [Bryobacterales bacterium]|nr:hypothetical protein [Bryobacterales bacterium]